MPKKPSCKHWGSLPRVLASVFGRGNVWEAALPGDMDDGKNYLAAKSHGRVRSEACCSLSIRPHKDSTCNTGDTGELGLIPGSGRSPGEGKGYSLQYSCLENPMDRGAWRAAVRGVTELTCSDTVA